MSERKRDGDVVLSYLSRIGLKPIRTLRQFWTDLERRHGKTTVLQLQQAVGEHASGQGETLYTIKNRDLTLSLDFASYSADLYRRLFDWWVERRPNSPQRVIDLGCDNGIVTCFLALLYPDAQLLGVDREPNAIRCAEMLADRLGLQNVRFQVANLQSDNWAEGLTMPYTSFDTVVTVRSVHELLGDDTVSLMEGPPHFSTLSLIDALMNQSAHGWPSSSTAALLSKVVQRMADKAEWVSFDRLTTMKSVTSCSYLFHTVGLEVDWEQASWIPFHEIGEAQTMPLVVYRKRAVESPAKWDARSLQEGVYRLYAPALRGALTPGQVYNDEGAEVLFERLEEQCLLIGYCAMPPGQSETRIELYQSSDLLLVYQRTASGYRQLDVHSLNTREELLQHFTQTMPNTFTAQGTPYERY